MSYTGSCHCGAVRFRLHAEPEELTTCDCSLCVKKNALMTRVHESQLEILSGSDALSEYRWNTGIARHFFCQHCGIYTFHRKRAMPDHYGVNIHCLDDFDYRHLPVRATEGASMSLHAVWPGPREAS
ncbi:Gfa-like protein [Aquitalea magnusonii]|uniref:Gfa-like protein n=1 Tax=Aquitalea magnusonii TaxID=332411 RepID=A0A3G9GIM4_9NEIS|nr:GFA family protein [Aquitalea magnusonii]BBF87748.1 Gfa-like protein [Aquitalea magnusonii]